MEITRSYVAVIDHPHRAQLTVPSIRARNSRANVERQSVLSRALKAVTVERDPVAEMIETRKKLVLEKAIKAIEQCAPDEMAMITHEMGGAIAFYTYLEEGAALTELSRWLEQNPSAQVKDIESKRSAVLELLQEKRDEDGK